MIALENSTQDKKAYYFESTTVFRAQNSETIKFYYLFQ